MMMARSSSRRCKYSKSFFGSLLLLLWSFECGVDGFFHYSYLGKQHQLQQQQKQQQQQHPTNTNIGNGCNKYGWIRCQEQELSLMIMVNRQQREVQVADRVVVQQHHTSSDEEKLRLVDGAPTSSISSSPPPAHSNGVATTLVDDNEAAVASFIVKDLEEHEPFMDNNHPEVVSQEEAEEDVAQPAPDAATTTTTTAVNDVVFPFSKIVNHQTIKQSLILVATNPKGLGRHGILIGGRHGTCKSVLAKSSIQLFGDDSEPIKFVNVPLHVMEDALLGSVDIEQSMETGRTVFCPGILTKAHQNILYIDDIHLLDDSIVKMLMSILSNGYVLVEREGLSVKYPCVPKLVIATYNPHEGELPLNIMDSFAFIVSSDTSTQRIMSIEDRVQVVQNVEDYYNQDNKYTCTTKDSGSTSKRDDLELLQQDIRHAHLLLPNVKITNEQILTLCQEATNADCEGQRAELLATQIAKTTAAIQDRTQVDDDDLKYAIHMAIVPRAQNPMYLPPGMESQEQPQDVMEDQVQEAPPPPTQLQPVEPNPEDFMPPPPPPTDTSEEEDQTDSHTMEENNTDKDDDTKEEEQEKEELTIPTEFLFGVNYDIPIDPSCVIQFSKSLTRKGKGGKHAKIFSTNRGRFVKAIFPKDPTNVFQSGSRLAIGATLRAAAPHQKSRRRLSQSQSRSHHRHRHHEPTREPKVHVMKDDFRIQRLARKSGTLITFVVDASGSMALNRMDAAKGAATILLQEAYKNRDKIALIEFHQRHANVLVPPTKSLALTKSRLESLPCGGGSPLAHALECAIRVTLNELKIKKDVGRAIIVLLTDGRANVPLSISKNEDTGGTINTNGKNTTMNGIGSTNGNTIISSDRKLLKDEVLAIAKQMSLLPDVDFLCIDTEDQYVGTGIAKDMTYAALGTYNHLQSTDVTTSTTSNLIRQGIQEATTRS